MLASSGGTVHGCGGRRLVVVQLCEHDDGIRRLDWCPALVPVVHGRGFRRGQRGLPPCGCVCNIAVGVTEVTAPHVNKRDTPNPQVDTHGVHKGSMGLHHETHRLSRKPCRAVARRCSWPRDVVAWRPTDLWRHRHAFLSPGVAVHLIAPPTVHGCEKDACLHTPTQAPFSSLQVW